MKCQTRGCKRRAETEDGRTLCAHCRWLRAREALAYLLAQGFITHNEADRVRARVEKTWVDR